MTQHSDHDGDGDEARFIGESPQMGKFARSASPTIMLRISDGSVHMHRSFNDFAQAVRSAEAFAGAGFTVAMMSATGRFLIGVRAKGRGERGGLTDGTIARDDAMRGRPCGQGWVFRGFWGQMDLDLEKTGENGRISRQTSIFPVCFRRPRRKVRQEPRCPASRRGRDGPAQLPYLRHVPDPGGPEVPWPRKPPRRPLSPRPPLRSPRPRCRSGPCP